MSEIKTKPTNIKVEDFLDTIENESKKEDSFAILELMKAITGDEPVMWGENIIFRKNEL